MKLIRGKCGHCGTDSKHLAIGPGTRCGRCGRLGKIEAVVEEETTKSEPRTVKRTIEILRSSRRKDRRDAERFYRSYEEHFGQQESSTSFPVPISGV